MKRLDCSPPNVPLAGTFGQEKECDVEGEMDDRPVGLLGGLHDVVTVHPVEVELERDVKCGG